MRGSRDGNTRILRGLEFAACWLAAVIIARCGSTNFVWSGGSGTAPYDTWSTAATTIQDAVQYACETFPAFSTVLVTDGTYGITSQIMITNGIVVRSVKGAAGLSPKNRKGFFGDSPAPIVYVATNGLNNTPLTPTGPALLLRSGTLLLWRQTARLCW